MRTIDLVPTRSPNGDDYADGVHRTIKVGPFPVETVRGVLLRYPYTLVGVEMDTHTDPERSSCPTVDSDTLHSRLTPNPVGLRLFDPRILDGHSVPKLRSHTRGKRGPCSQFFVFKFMF